MHIARRFTTAGQDPYGSVPFRNATSEIRNPDGSVVFQAEGIEVPAEWSQVACDIIAQKYFRKAGVPARLAQVEEDGVPSWLWRRMADAAAMAALPEDQRYGGETDAREVFDRMAGTWTYWGWKGGYFDAEEDACAFYDEIRLMLARQMGAPNSPQWFNTGLYWAYGIDGPAQGHYYVDYRSGELTASTSAYEHPQPHACFIQSVADDLVNEGGIMDLWVREARIFKYGSGSGSNFSKLRGDGERLSGGGRSSGLMSFLRIGDRAAGAIKSGGTTRRAAKMVIVDIDHPDIEAFIDWKVVEEQKVAALVAGSKLAARHLNLVMAACHQQPEGAADPCDPAQNPALKREIRAARRAMIPENCIQRVIQFARQGYTAIDLRTYDTDWDSEAYLTVAGQNSNNSVRVSNEFLDRVAADGPWELTRRTDGKVAKTIAGARIVGPDRARRLGLGRPRAAIRHDDQRLAHLPRERPDQRLEPVLGIQFPRRHRVQSRLVEPDGVPPRRRERGRPWAGRRWRARTRRRLRRRGVCPCGAAVDPGARNLGDDGAVPVARDRPPLVCLPHSRPRLRQSRRPVDGDGHRL